MSAVLQYKHDQTPAVSPVEREAKNPDSTRITAMDVVGLTWIFQDDDL